MQYTWIMPKEVFIPNIYKKHTEDKNQSSNLSISFSALSKNILQHD
jgi:ribosomal protein L28